MKYQKIRGTQDHFENFDNTFNEVEKTLAFIAKNFGFYEIKTPIFESIELFKRSVGDSSDIVNKELYNFMDKSNRHLALRPEGTASIARAIIENKIASKSVLPLKYFYVGAMFRYERPQNGRLRQFHQFGIECVGTKSIFQDIEVLNLALMTLSSLGIDKISLKINSLCSFKSRTRWMSELKKYLEKYKNDLSEDSVRRLDKNPLRILDDKVDGKKDFVKKAPKLFDFATKEEIEKFKLYTNALDKLKINYEWDQTLVRGLDYYTDFVFEIVSKDERLVGQDTIIAGGRYDELYTELGGNPLPCFGFATGIERLCILANQNKIANKCVDAYVFPIKQTDTLNYVSLLISQSIRLNGLSASTNFNLNKIDKHFKYSEEIKSKYIIMIGEKELEKNIVLIKDQKTKKQKEIKIDDVVNYIMKKENLC